jgi:hypothetical protein
VILEGSNLICIHPSSPCTEQGIRFFAPSAAECGGGSIPSIGRYGAASANIKDDPSKDYSFFFFLLSPPSPLFSLFLLWLRGANEKIVQHVKF